MHSLSPTRKMIYPAGILRCFFTSILTGFLTAQLGSSAVAQPSADNYLTTNLNISPRWIDSETLVFSRQTENREWQTLQVNAKTGELSEPKDSRSAKGKRSAGLFLGGSVPRSGPATDSIEIQLVNRTHQPVQLFWIDSSGGRRAYQKVAPGQTVSQQTYAGHVWEAVGDDETFYGSAVTFETSTKLIIEKPYPRQKAKTKRRKPRPNQASGNVRISEGKLQFRPDAQHPWQDRPLANRTLSDSQHLVSPSRSPDGSVITAWLKTDVQPQPVWTVESSPKDGGRAKLNTRPYRLPGDPMDTYELVVIDAETADVLPVDVPVIDFGRPRVRWKGDHHAIFEKVDRGHQRFRLFVVDTKRRTVQTPIDETTETFIWTSHGPGISPVTYLDETDEVIYASEKSGFRHLYLVDLNGNNSMRPVTQGEFLVRSLLHVDPVERYVDAEVGEFYDDQDPYHRHLVRVNIDTGQLVPLTKGDGDHDSLFSPDRQYVVVSHSRVDSPPVHELRRASDGSLIRTLETAKRLAASFDLPTRFTAKGRDGETDIWGIICFPKDYDPHSKQAYPVIENIYAGPHDSHVPKRYRHSQRHREWTDLGFIVVQIDGMGTANRSKAFHDVCWQNLKDAGFPDRIAWLKAAAKKHPAIDITRVGIYGTSAGGQNACGALLFHPDFYKAAMASCGCHDNRMDKSSWNEQWMGYPVGPHYSQCSNIDNAEKLQGDLLLLVGELDSNVPPESTLRLVDALIQADKRFEFLLIPGMGHSDGGSYGRRLTREFFVKKLNPIRHSIPAAKNAPKANSKDSIALTNLTQLSATSRWQLANDLFQTDCKRLKRRFPIRISQKRLAQMQYFLDAWTSKLPSPETLSAMDVAAVEDLRLNLKVQRSEWLENQRQRSLFTLRFPFVEDLIELTDVGRRGIPVDFSSVAPVIAGLSSAVLESIESNSKTGNHSASESKTPPHPIAANLISAFESWQRFYADYDPEFDWWVGGSANQLRIQLQSWSKSIPELPRPEDPPKETAKESAIDSILGHDYPEIENLLPGAWMPAVMDRYLADVGSASTDRVRMLNGWKRTLETLRLDDLPFSKWCIDDQVDFHRLRREIETGLRIEAEPTGQTISRSGDESGLEGVFVGRSRLQTMLNAEFLDHTPEELIAFAESEYISCRQEMLAASREMGLGDDWQAAVERIKNQHVAPGKQPELIRKTAQESIDWIREKELMTVSEFAENTWRMQMMSPERQRVNPFFTGGEVISVSFPTQGMSLSDRQQSLRGNNLAFARATVHHELIPGHHYQGFQTSRFQPHRRSFRTPFWLEGWAVYWEFVLYEGGFPRTPEERLGFLVWRAHRYARIIFSLRFHLGQLSPDQCVNFLVDNVGFDRRNATAEVRRSIGPEYPPLYQAAYMIGAMQFRQLAKEWNEQDRGTEKAFHDAVMQLGPMPIALLRARLFNQELRRDQPPVWRFEFGNPNES